MRHTILALLMLTTASCATVHYDRYMPTRPPIEVEGLPRISIDRAASMIAVSAGKWKLNKSAFSRSEILNGLEAYWNKNAGTGEKVKTRIIISSTIIRGWEVIQAMTGILSALTGGAYLLIGGPTDGSNADASVVMDIGDKRITGSGHGRCLAGLYYPGEATQCAFAKAVINAVKNAAKEGFQR